jgi:hypothetical protein
MYELKKMSAAEIWDNAFKVLSANLVPLLIINASIMVPLFIVSFLVTLMASTTGNLTFVSAVIMTMSLLSLLLVQPIASAASTKLIADRYLETPSTVGGSYRYAFRILLPLIGALILATLATMVGYILLIIPGIILTVRLSLVSQACVVEGRGGMNAFKRSMELTDGSAWKFFSLMMGLFGLALAAEHGLDIALTAGTWPYQISYLGIQVLLGALGSAVWVVAYLERRCDLEAFDLEMLAAALDD